MAADICSEHHGLPRALPTLAQTQYERDTNGGPRKPCIREEVREYGYNAFFWVAIEDCVVLGSRLVKTVCMPVGKRVVAHPQPFVVNPVGLSRVIWSIIPIQ